MDILLCMLLFKQHCSKNIYLCNEKQLQGSNQNSLEKRPQENVRLILSGFNPVRGKGIQQQVSYAGKEQSGILSYLSETR